MWLPFWPATVNLALARAFMISRQETDGSFSDSYFHELFFAFKLVNFFWENFQVTFDGFFNVGKCFLAAVSFAYRSRKFQALS
jgi:hypothetical protein